MSFPPRCPYQTPLIQSSLPLGPHCRSRQTPENEKGPRIFVVIMATNLFCIHIIWKHSSGFVFSTCSQVSRIITSSVARSSWVSSPGTSSIWGRKRIQCCCGRGVACYSKTYQRLTMKFPVLLEQAKSLGGWLSILSLSLVEVRYSVFPPRASQNWSVKTTDGLQVTIVLHILGKIRHQKGLK